MIGKVVKDETKKPDRVKILPGFFGLIEKDVTVRLVGKQAVQVVVVVVAWDVPLSSA